MPDSEGQEEEHVGEPFGPCPGCAKPLVVCYGDNRDWPAAVLHVAPTCGEFDGRDANDFLLWVCDVRQAERMGTVGGET